MNFELSKNTQELVSNHWKTFVEVFWMTLAAVFPVILTWLFLFLQSEELSFQELVLNVFLEGPIFAYVATLLAPFLFLIAKVLTGKKDTKVSLGGLSLFVAIVMTIVSVFLFYDKQLELIERKEEIVLNKSIIAELDVTTLEAAINKATKNNISNTQKREFESRDWIALLCYLGALALFYYSIYVNNKPSKPPAELARETSVRLQNVLDEEFGDE